MTATSFPGTVKLGTVKSSIRHDSLGVVTGSACVVRGTVARGHAVLPRMPSALIVTTLSHVRDTVMPVTPTLYKSTARERRADFRDPAVTHPSPREVSAGRVERPAVADLRLRSIAITACTVNFPVEFGNKAPGPPAPATASPSEAGSSRVLLPACTGRARTAPGVPVLSSRNCNR